MEISWWNLGLGGMAILGFGFAIWSHLRQSVKGIITIYRQNPIYLLHTLAKDLSDLTVNFKEKPVDVGLMYVSGFISNTGRRDIRPEDVHETLNCQLPDGYIWKDFAIIEPDEGVAGEIIDDVAKVSFSLLKKWETIEYKGLIENTEQRDDVKERNRKFPSQSDRIPSSSSRDIVRWKARIADTTIRTAIPLNQTPWSATIAGIVALVLGLAMTGIGIYSVVDELTAPRLVFELQDGERVSIGKYSMLRGGYTITGVDSDSKKVLSREHVEELRYVGTAETGGNWVMIILIIIGFGLMASVLFISSIHFLSSANTERKVFSKK